MYICGKEKETTEHIIECKVVKEWLIDIPKVQWLRSKKKKELWITLSLLHRRK